MKSNFEIISENLGIYSGRSRAEDDAAEYWLSRAAAVLGTDELKALCKTLDERKAAFLSEKVSLSGKKINFHPDITTSAPEKKENRISLVENALSEGALKTFFGTAYTEKVIKNNFIDIFEDVYGGGASYCIAPVENTDSGKLISFYSLISNYNFKIIKTCDVEHTGGDGSTKFALISPAPVYIGGGKNIEISVTPHDTESIGRILRAAAFMRLKMRRVDSVPFAHITGEYSFYILFEAEYRQSVTDLLTFLFLEGISFTPIGIFENNK